MFTAYVGKPTASNPNPVMKLAQFQRLFRDMVSLQRDAAEAVYKAGYKVFTASPIYQQMGFLERAAMSATIGAFKMGIFTAFDVALGVYSEMKNVAFVDAFKALSPGGAALTSALFLKNAPGVLFGMLTSNNLVVAQNLFEKFMKGK